MIDSIESLSCSTSSTLHRVKPNRSCEHCGSPFYASPGHIKKGWGRFCTNVCFGLATRGEKSPRWSGDAAKCVCRQCGKEFRQKPSHIAKGEGKFCSRSCWLASYPEKPIQTCGWCGKKFVIFACWKKKGVGKCCSRSCLGMSQRTKVRCVCRVCEGVFYRKPCDMKRGRGIGSFCSMRCKAKWQSGTPLSTSGANRSAPHGGKRDDLGGLYVRSRWEANWARYLNWLVSMGEIVSWEYEPDTFEFVGIKRGSRFYTPDFKVTNKDGRIEYHEVKGWMDQKSRTKLKRMAKYHPTVKIIIVDGPHYRDVARKIASIIPGWEESAKGGLVW